MEGEYVQMPMRKQGKLVAWINLLAAGLIVTPLGITIFRAWPSVLEVSGVLATLCGIGIAAMLIVDRLEHLLNELQEVHASFVNILKSPNSEYMSLWDIQQIRRALKLPN